MRLFKNEKIRKVLISALCVVTMLAVSIPVYAIQEMEEAEKAYFLTYDEFKKMFPLINTDRDLI